MPLKAICLFILLLLCQVSIAQKLTADKTISDIYQASVNKSIDNRDTIGYYLVKFKKPQFKYQKNLQLLKRISYDYYVVASSHELSPGNNIASVYPANYLWKAADNLLLNLQKHPKSSKNIEIIVSSISDSSLTAMKKLGTVVSRTADRIILNTSFGQLPKVLRLPGVNFANEIRTPHEDLAISDIDLGANNISSVPNTFPGTNGTGINVAIKENLYDNDLDLLGRSFTSFKAASITSGHATTMATLIGGNANSYIKGLGCAPQVKFTSSDFAQLMPDSTAVFKAFDIGLQNHSYGTGIENYYGAEAVAYDQQVYETDSITHVFSSGNIGTSAPTTGLYSGITGVANLSGTFKQAKNVLVAGGTGRTNQPEDLSSAGPSYDGRVKPELVADGEDGTSGAAAQVTGTIVLVQQAYKQSMHHLPSAALVKAILINTADDIGRPGLDYKTGYGKLNALEAVRTIKENRFINDRVANSQQKAFTIHVPANSALFKVSLAWNDPPAALNAPYALINDLDLSVTTPEGKTLAPWTLSAYPSADSLSLPAKRGKDSINNAEQVTLQNPPAGDYIIHIKGSKVNAPSQAFYIAYQTIQANGFEWIYPSGNEQLFAADVNYLRWQNSYSNASGKLSISYDAGTTWQPIDDIALQNNYYTWNAPNLFTSAVVKMEINGQSYISKAFSISKPSTINVGYNCTDGTLLHWNAQPGAYGYAIYTIKDNILTRLTTTSDTTIIIPTKQQSSSYYAISAQGKDFEGIKSYTIDASDQGVGCYVKTLLANVVDHQVLLNLNLGSVVNLTAITWEKLTADNQYIQFGTTAVTQALGYQFTDPNPSKGIQFYRAKLITANNTIVYSNPASVNYLLPNQFVVYPNPVSNILNVLGGDINNYQFKLYDSVGKLSMNADLTQLQSTIQLTVSPGLYIYVILLNGKIIDQGKLVKI